MFEHEDFDHYAFEEVPLNRDIYLMDERWMAEYEQSIVAVLDGSDTNWQPVGYISYAAARRVLPDGIEFSWYPNIHDRFHEVAAWLPRDAFVACVGCWQYDEKPHVFVNGDWLNQLHLRSYTIFSLIDAIGVKDAIKRNAITREKLVRLRDRIDELASHFPSVSFISFADSLLLKSNWTVGHFGSEVKYTYRPETFLELFSKLQLIYREELGLKIYGVLTQGSNEYYEDDVTHVSSAGNHVSLNSLGLPFAQLQAIEHAARAAIRSGTHRPHDIYMDQLFFRSINWKFSFEKNEQPSHSYLSPMEQLEGEYFYADIGVILENLES